MENQAFLFIYFVFEREPQRFALQSISYSFPVRFSPSRSPLLPSPADIIPFPAAIARPGLYCQPWPLFSSPAAVHLLCWSSPLRFCSSHSLFLTPAAIAHPRPSVSASAVLPSPGCHCIVWPVPVDIESIDIPPPPPLLPVGQLYPDYPPSSLVLVRYCPSPLLLHFLKAIDSPGCATHPMQA